MSPLHASLKDSGIAWPTQKESGPLPQGAAKVDHESLAKAQSATEHLVPQGWVEKAQYRIQII